MTIMHKAAVAGDLQRLLSLHAEGIEWDAEVSGLAALHGHLHIIHHVFQHQLPVSEHLLYKAVLGGHLDILKYAHEQGCQWYHHVTAAAVNYLHMDCLKYCVENGCPHSVACTINAVRRHSLEFLKYLHSVDCKWNHDVVFDCVLYNSPECFNYLIKHECPFNKQDVWYQLIDNMINLTAYFNRLPMVRTLIEFGYTCPDREFNSLVKGLKYFVTDDLLDREVWLREYLMLNIDRINKQSLPVLHRYKAKLHLWKQYAFVECDGLLPNHVIQYVVCSYF